MSEVASITLMDHELADDELAWMQAVYADFGKLRASFGRDADSTRRRRCAKCLAGKSTGSPTAMDLSGPGPWRHGRKRHGRGVGRRLPAEE